MQLLDDLGGKEYIQKLKKKKESLDAILWITCFGRSSGTIA